MGTPLRNYLSPKNLIPAIQNVRQKLQKITPTKFLNVPSATPKCVKSLNFSKDEKSLVKVSIDTSSTSNVRNIKPIVNLQSRTDNFGPKENYFADNITPRSLKYLPKTLSVDTPDRQSLLELGLPTGIEYELLGTGRFGTVVKGLYKDKPVAVKVINVRSPMCNEVNAIQLQHENIIQVLKVVAHLQSFNYGIVIMEYIENGTSLQNIINEYEGHSPFPIARVVKYAADVCRAVKFCHDNSILHLDIKPKNVIVTSNGIAKLCDFGSSWKIGSNEYTLQGTTPYCAPELFRGKFPTEKCDVYSIGILLWQLIFHKPPYEGIEHADVLIYKIVKFNLRPSSSTEIINEDFQSLYENCWQENPRDRPDITTIIRQINDILFS